jgi:hypothetical protein
MEDPFRVERSATQRYAPTASAGLLARNDWPGAAVSPTSRRHLMQLTAGRAGGAGDSGAQPVNRAPSTTWRSSAAMSLSTLTSITTPG